MCKYKAAYRWSAWMLVRLAFLYLPVFVAAQEPVLQAVETGHLKRYNAPPAALFSRPVHSVIAPEKAFYDTLRTKASKNVIARRLFDAIVIGPDSARTFTGVSEASFYEYRGRIIRNINIKRLDVFGSDIENPAGNNLYSAQRILNKTHINTNEKIIRNNLIFSSGDTLSPILLSDNERILRELSFIDDARIKVIPVSKDEVDILIITKDVYSLGASFSPFGFTRGRISVFDNNFLGLGHEFGLMMPFDKNRPGSPGFGFHYMLDNISSSFINLRMYYSVGLGEESYGFNVGRKLVSIETKYAGGIGINHMYMKKALDTLTIPGPLQYNLQDYWLARAFMLDRETVTRLIVGGRYTNNNVFDKPEILPDSYYHLQKYKLFLASLTLSRQKFYKSNLIYSYGRTEDIPYGGALTVTAGREFNEFKVRNYAASEVSFSRSFSRFGYIYASAGLGSFINKGSTEQGILSVNVNYFSDLLPLGPNMVRNFLRVDYTRGFDRNSDEQLKYISDRGLTGFRNDSARGAQRITINYEAVVFSPLNIYGFRFVFFGFADFSALSGTNQILANGSALSGIGMGLRIRNDNLVFRTFQIRIGFFPEAPLHSSISHLTVSGEEPLRFQDFGTGAPSMIPFR